MVVAYMLECSCGRRVLARREFVKHPWRSHYLGGRLGMVVTGEGVPTPSSKLPDLCDVMGLVRPQEESPEAASTPSYKGSSPRPNAAVLAHRTRSSPYRHTTCLPTYATLAPPPSSRPAFFRHPPNLMMSTGMAAGATLQTSSLPFSTPSRPAAAWAGPSWGKPWPSGPGSRWRRLCAISLASVHPPRQ